MRINLLGVTSVTAGEGTADETTVAGARLGGRRAHIILAMLALSDGPVSTSTLAAALWGEELPETWSTSLRGAIRALRTALAPVGGGDNAIVRTVPAGYCLAPGVEVDVRRTRATVVDAERLLAQGRSRASYDCAASIAHARGDALLPQEDAEWLTPHRVAVQAIAVRALRVMSAAASDLGEPARAIETAYAAVRSDPLDELSHRTLIHAYGAAGDRAGAARAFDECRTVLADELGVEPSQETVAAYLSAALDPDPPARAPVPRCEGSFVGRADDVRALRTELRRPGLVTVVGRGGVGKSRLVAEVVTGARPVADTYWASLASVTDDSLVGVTLALRLQVDAGTDPVGSVAEHLARQGTSLLVLDGADVVTDGAATVAATLTEACPRLVVVVTSRTALEIDGERLVHLDPLPAPAIDDELADNPQIRLLTDRLRAAGGSLDSAQHEALVALCERCDGLPLALELAAAQLTDMSVADLLDELGERRHDRLRQMTAASYAQLDAAEAGVFRRFAVLDGPVPLSFARAVLAGDEVPPERVVRILRELSSRGLITVDRSTPRWTYSQDDDVHHYAAELLDRSGGTPGAYDALAGAVRALLPDDAREPPTRFAAPVTAVLGCVRSLFSGGLAGYADRDRCLELAFRLHRYWAATSVAEGRWWLTRLLSPPEAVAGSRWRSYATYALGYLGYWAGDTDQALPDLRAAVELFGEESTPFMARALIYTAGLLDDLDRPVEALDFVRRSMSAAEPFGTDLYVAAAMGLGSVLSERADPRAADYAEEAVARCRIDGSSEQLAALLPTAAMVCWQVGDLYRARTYVADAWPLHREHRRIARVVLLSAAAGIAYADRDFGAAIDHGRAADEEGEALGVEREMPLIRAVLARALLRSGDSTGAADRALAGVDVAAVMPVRFPIAVSLETAAVVATALGADDRAVGLLVGTARQIRLRGDRPPAVPLAGDLLALPVGAPAPVDHAIDLARRTLTQLPR